MFLLLLHATTAMTVTATMTKSHSAVMTTPANVEAIAMRDDSPAGGRACTRADPLLVGVVVGHGRQ